MLVVVRPAGKVDLLLLEATSSACAMRHWVKARLQGHDPFCSWNTDVPENLFIDIWDRADPHGKVRFHLSQACADLLQEARQAEGAWIRHLLIMIGSILPETCRDSLVEAVKNKEYLKDPLWLQVAAKYAPQTLDIMQIWLELLQAKNPVYVCAAQSALVHDKKLIARLYPRKNSNRT
jgi:hypothetical protein